MTLTTPAPRRTGKRLAIAPRVSTQDQESYGTSLDDQTLKGRLFAQLHDYTVADECIYAGDESGALPPAQRPLLQRMLAAARAHKYDAIVFHKIDRIARRLKYILEIWDAFEELGVTVLIIDPGIDTSTPIGRAIRNILATLAELEHETIRERTAGGRARRLTPRKDGDTLILPPAWLSGLHYGYRYQKANRMEGVAARVTMHEGEADVVRRIYRRRAQGGGISTVRIARELTAEGIANPGGTGAWTAHSVARILGRRAYTGEGEWGLTTEGVSKTGKRSTVKRRDGRPPLRVAYPRIISAQEWDDAHAVASCGVRPARAGVERYLLRGGMVRCAQHDLCMSGTSNGRDDRYYRCTSEPKRARGEPAIHSVPSLALDDVVWAEVMAFLHNPARGRASAARLIAQADRRAAELAAQQELLEQRLRDADGERQALLRLYRRGTIPTDALDQSMAEVDAQRAPLRASLARVTADLELARADVPAAGEIDHVCTVIAAGAAVATAAEKRALLDLLHVAVSMTGYDYEIRGLVPEMTVRGSLAGERGQATGDSQASLLSPVAGARAPEGGVQSARGFCSMATLYSKDAWHPRSFVLSGRLAA